jgi:hypothetical protein
MFKILLFCVFCFANVSASTLQSTINLTPMRPSMGQQGKIIPSTNVALSAVVRNVGEEASPAGEIFVRFAFRPPHENEPNSVLFETERVELPALAAGEEKAITFNKNHLLPTVFDFVRYDWAMREYEAIIEINGKQAITGTRALAFTAYYYEGASASQPTDF